MPLVTSTYEMFERANSFNHSISDWNVSAVTNMIKMFNHTPGLSNINKGKIHQSFSSNPNWPYDWAEFMPNIPPSDLKALFHLA